jgi:hypothetical protein
MTCGDVNEGGVIRLVEVPGCRCLHRDDDVGAVVFGMNKAHKNRNPNTHINAQKFGAKRNHKSYQIDVKRGNMVLKWGCQDGASGCWRMYTGFSRFGGRLFPVLAVSCAAACGGNAVVGDAPGSKSVCYGCW